MLLKMASRRSIGNFNGEGEMKTNLIASFDFNFHTIYTLPNPQKSANSRRHANFEAK